jgi:hypothetical protein
MTQPPPLSLKVLTIFHLSKGFRIIGMVQKEKFNYFDVGIYVERFFNYFFIKDIYKAHQLIWRD